NGEIVEYQFSGRDITERKKAQEKIQSYVQRLEALRAIDKAITSDQNLETTLGIFAEQTVDKLKVDAASVLIYDPDSKTMKFHAGAGLNKDTIREYESRSRDNAAYLSTSEQGIVHLSDLSEKPGESDLKILLNGEKAVECYLVAMISKEKMIGILKLYNSKPREIDEDWKNFLEALATQGAIAISDAQKVIKLRNSNIDLEYAYNVTLEGWAKALELRDNETKGHSDRVTDMTLILGISMGIQGDALVQLRRGSLLHDIGKMGIPDSILHKPGPLNEDEWIIMRQHPIFAYDLLQPVPFLQPALDIPYCHHEKWDGTGYPRGLKGEEIPISARIFAVVDVWDALLSDRPYRKAWPEEKVLNYLKEQTGKHFDPLAVETFLRILSRYPGFS
ncbi:MAG: HD-GYP domain-containing protein, partial [Anaerolineaceae bacterium]|nr:HD-GYP domain-containing protein [Anaerolineaceae bacterium]